MTTYTNEPTPTVIRIDQGNSPRWLQIARDAVWTIVGILIIASAVLVLFGIRSVANGFNTSVDPSPTPACYITGDPDCVQPGG